MSPGKGGVARDFSCFVWLQILKSSGCGFVGQREGSECWKIMENKHTSQKQDLHIVSLIVLLHKSYYKTYIKQEKKSIS